jgi:sugar lactone lactonase YvrE
MKRLRAGRTRFCASLLVLILTTVAWPTTVRAQHLYVSEGMVGAGSHIYQFSTAGERTTIYNGYMACTGLAIDPAGNVFVGSNDSIYKFSPGGAMSTFTTFYGAYQGLAFDKSGNLFTAGDYIDEFAPNGQHARFADMRNMLATGLAFDKAGNLFVSEYGGGKIYKFTPSGTRSLFASGLQGPEGLTFDKAGNLYEADSISGHIYKFSADGTPTPFASGLARPFGLACDDAGDLFVTERTTGILREFKANGTQSTIATGLTLPSFIAYQSPEPATLAMLALGGLILAQRRRKA